MDSIDQQPQPVGSDDPVDSAPAVATPPAARAAVASSPESGPPPVPKQRRHGNGYWRWYTAVAVLAAAVVGGAVVSTGNKSDTAAVTALAVVDPDARVTAEATEPTPGTVPSTSTDETTAPDLVVVAGQQGTLLDASAVGARVIPSVVTVQISGTAFNGQEGLLGSGSGVVFDNLGHILTNNHVVAAGTSYEIVLADGRVYPAQLVGTDPTTDLAVLSVTAQGLEAIVIGDSDALTVGEPAVAVGSPLGLDGGPSLTVGVISAFGREVRTDSTTMLYGMLQTDAPITSGSSGGALVDGAGRLVGITTAVGVSDVGIEGIGFATPIEIVTRVANEIIANGEASSPYLGIFGETALNDTSDGGSAPVGILVSSVEPGSAAEDAGLNEGDVIAAIGGDSTKTFNELVALLRRYQAGSTVTVTLGTGATVNVILGQRPAA